jgi:gliding motility-associated-like protein
MAQTYIASITDAKQCKAKDSMRIMVNQNPVAKFTYPETCLNLPLLLSDSSKVIGDSIIQRKWNFSGIDTMQIKDWLIDLQGNSDGLVSLIVRSGFGCEDTISKTVYLNPYAEADFSTKDVCFGDTVQFVNNSTLSKGVIQSSIWDFGDGNSSVQSQNKHLYNVADTYQVTLIAISDKNCNDTIAKFVTVYPRPTTSFSVSNVCLKDSIFAINSSSIINDSITNQWWYINNDTISQEHLNYLLSYDTSYIVTLKTSSAFGCRDSLSKSVEVYTNPKAMFNVMPVCEGKKSTIISSSSIRKGAVTAYNYAISDGGSYTNQNFVHQFAKGDTFDIRLIVTSGNNCRDTLSKQAIVYPRIIPSFNVSDTCVSAMTVIKDQSTFVNTGIRSWVYDFGNGDSAFISNPFYQYSAPGTYTIRQTVTSKEGCIYDTSGKVTIYPLPKPDFRDTNKCVDNQFNFFSKSTISSGTIKSYKWYFGDNTTSVLKDPGHVFPGAGNYVVKQIASSNFGCVDSIEKSIVSYPPVQVKFGVYNVCLGDPIEFTDSSIVPSSTIKQYQWWFGDNDTSMQKQPWHTYKTDDTFKVKLRITTAYDCDYDSSTTLTVYPVPTANFKTDPDQGTIVNPEIQITDFSTGADTLIYDLGDGTFSMMRNLVNSYPDSGVFTLRQTVWNTYGCRDTFIKTITIRYLFVFNTPTAFSPNNDGINDVFAPGGIGYTKYSMWIYNRWGEMIYETTDGKGWDGTYAGEDLMTDVYAVRYKVKDFKGRNHYYSATFTLLR